MAQNAHERAKISAVSQGDRREQGADTAAEQEAVAQRREAIVQSLQDGCSRSSACRAAGVARRTFYNWLSEDKAFARRVEEAERQSVKTMESVVYVAGLKSEEDPRYLRAALAWLQNNAGWKTRVEQHNVETDGSESRDAILGQIRGLASRGRAGGGAG